MKRLLLLVLTSGALLNAQPPAQTETEGVALEHATFTVRLLSPISTNTSSEGDMFTAVVEEPAEYRAAIFEGRITKLKKSKKGLGKGKAEIAFQFDAITFNGKTTLVDADLTEVANSKGVKSVDEEGQVIGKTSNKKRIIASAVGAGAGAVVGGILGGGKGAALGSMIGLGAGTAVGLTMTTTGANLEFLPGSTFTLDVSDPARPKQ